MNSDSQAKTHSVDYAGTYEITDETSEGQPVYVLYDRTSYKSGGSNRRVMKKYALLYSEDRWKITYFGYRSTDHFLACLKCPGGTTCYGGAAKPYVWVAATSDYAGNVIVSPAPHMTVIETV